MPGKLQMTLAACLCAGAIAGCGDSEDGTIPQDFGDSLLLRLDQVDERVAAGECDGSAGAEAQAVEVARLIDEELPPEVDPEVADALREAAGNLVELTQEQCTQGPSGETGPETTTTDDTTTEETTTPTTTTTTTEEETTTDEETGDGGNQGGGPPADGGPPDGDTGPPTGNPGNQGGGSGEGEVEIEPPPESGGVGTEGKGP